MQNGYRQDTGNFAPETALGTGAAEPIVDEREAAEQVPSVDNDTASSKNHPGHETINYSGDDTAEPTNDLQSDGRDLETRRSEDDDQPGGDSVGSVLSDSDVNAKAEDVRPEEPQATKATRKAKA